MAQPLDRSIYLASRSPRRRELLGHIGVKFHLLLFRNRPGAAPDVNEDPLPDEAPRDYVLRVARAKAAVGWKRMRERNLPRHPVLAADTTVALGMRIFGKPSSRRAAGDPGVRRHRRIRRQGGRLRHPGPRGPLRRRNPRQPVRHRRAAAVRDGATAAEDGGFA
jgi:hypothetical protein